MTRKNETHGRGWLRWIFIVAVLLYLLWLVFLKRRPQREDFPFF